MCGHFLEGRTQDVAVPDMCGQQCVAPDGHNIIYTSNLYPRLNEVTQLRAQRGGVHRLCTPPGSKRPTRARR